MKILREGRGNCHSLCIKEIEHIKTKLTELYKQWQTIFTWQDGPLVQAMRDGDMFLIDEISLADDSVLERINSVLEPERKLVILLTYSMITCFAILGLIFFKPSYFCLIQEVAGF